MTPPSQAGRRWSRRRRELAWALAIGAASAAWLLLSYRRSFFSSDTCRDLLYARDLAEGRLLHLSGVSASLFGMRQGALFPALLGLGLAVHAPLVAVRGVMLGLFVASVVVLHAGARWRLGPGAALATTVLWAGLGPQAVGLPTLDNPNLVALPLVVFTLALLDLGADRGPLAAGAAGAALGLAILGHVAAALLLPALVLGLLWGRRPALGVAAGLPALGATLLLLSPGTLVVDAGRLPPAALAAGAAALLVAGLGTRRGLRRLSPAGRGLVLLGVAAGLQAAALGAVAAAGGQAWTWRYVAPGLPAAALLVGALVARVDHRAVTAAAVALGAALAVPASRWAMPRGLSLESVPAVVATLSQEGYGPAALRLRLRSALRQPLLACAIALAPHEAGPTPPDDLMLVTDGTVQGTALAGWTRPLGEGGVRVRRYAPWLDQVHPRICLSGAGGRRCASGAWDAVTPSPPGAPLYTAAYPELPGVRTLSVARTTGATITFPLRVTGPGGERTLVLLPDRASDGCGFRIARVTGVAVRSALPATRVVVEGRPGQTGEVTVEVPLGPGHCDPSSSRLACPPSVAELPGGVAGAVQRPSRGS